MRSRCERFLRALVPVGRDPLEVEVDGGPQDVSDPRAVVLFGQDQPLRILEKDIHTERRAVCALLSTQSRKPQNLLRTRGGRADASLGVDNHVDLEVEHSFLETACEYVSCEAGHLLCPSQRVDDVVHLRPKARVVEHGELIEPGVVDEASVAQPENGVFGMLGIGYNG